MNASSSPRVAVLAVCVCLLGGCGSSGSSGNGGSTGSGPASDACMFFDDPDNCFVRLTKEALACVGGAYSPAAAGTLSADGLQCTSKDGAVSTTFAQPISGSDATYDVTVKRGGTLCFRYRGMGSGGTPATFASTSVTLDMSSDPSTGDLVLACEGKTFRGSIVEKCAGTKVIPSVGTSYSPSGAGKRIAMTLDSGKDVYECEN